MNAKKSESISTYQQYLPIILQKDAFIGKFLLAFEKILTGLNETPSQEQIITDTTEKTENIPALEEIIDNIHLYFNPQETPEEFLPWLAGWVALSLRDDWEVKIKQEFIQQIVNLYQLRGTKQGLKKILQIYLKNSGFGENVEVFDEFDNFPNYFQVQLTLKDRDPDKYWRQAKIAKAIIDKEKPAHTFYTLKILAPTMQLTQPSQVTYPFKLLTAPPEIQELQPNIEKLEFAAIVEITEPSTVTSDLLNKITVRLPDNFSDYHLLTPETIIENNKITVKRTLYSQQFLQTIDELAVNIKNLNNVNIDGKVIVRVSLKINQRLSTYTLLEQDFNLAAVPLDKILQICWLENGKVISDSIRNEQEEIVSQTIPTILGTISQSLK